MSAPLISIVIPAYNSERFIAETLESVITQTYTDFEALVIDDGSTDNQKDIILDFAKRDARIKYFPQPNAGVSAARNKGIHLSTGRYLAFLDADDVWLPRNLELKIRELRTGDAGLVHSDALVINENSTVVNGVLSGIGGSVLDPLLLWKGTQIPGPSSVLVKREVLDKAGLFDAKLSTAADKDFFIRVASYFQIARIAEVTWKYRIHSSNMHKNIALMERDVLYLYEKATRLKLFRDEAFRKKCYSSMYLILAASWAGDGKSLAKALPFLWRGLKADPSALPNVLKRIFRRWK